MAAAARRVALVAEPLEAERKVAAHPEADQWAAERRAAARPATVVLQAVRPDRWVMELKVAAQPVAERRTARQGVETAAVR